MRLRAGTKRHARSKPNIGKAPVPDNAYGGTGEEAERLFRQTRGVRKAPKRGGRSSKRKH